MTEAKKIDILVGVKGEQSLRDAVRQLNEEHEGDLELAPVGKKDWIAGARIGNDMLQKDLEAACRKVHQQLMDLGSEQRIRYENIRLYSIQAPVPVFKETVADAAEEQSPIEKEPTADVSEEAAEPERENYCPICKRTVHAYNLHYNTDGKVVGCFMCGGNPIDF